MITVGLADWTSALNALPGFVQAALSPSTPSTPDAAQANALIQPAVMPPPAKASIVPYLVLGGVGLLAVGTIAVLLGRKKRASAPAATTSSGA